MKKEREPRGGETAEGDRGEERRGGAVEGGERRASH